MAADAIERETGVRAAVCPVCGYDRRGATGERCTECGKVVGAGVRSRIPWVGRRYTGRVRAYVRTSWMAVLHPGLLAEETRWRVNRRDAVRFYWVTILLATVVGTGMFAAAFVFREEWWASVGVDPSFRELASATADWISTPAFDLWNSWLILIPVTVSLFLGSVLSAAIFRWLLGIGERDDLVRRRTRRMGFYFSAQGVWFVGLMGPWLIDEMILQETPKWLGDGWVDVALLNLQWILPTLFGILFFISTSLFLVNARATPGRFLKMRVYLLTMSGLAVVPFGAVQLARTEDYYWNHSFWGEINAITTAVTGSAAFIAAIMATWYLASKRRRVSIARAWGVVLFYPLILALAWPILGGIVLWVCGYVAIGIASMLFR